MNIFNFTKRRNQPIINSVPVKFVNRVNVGGVDAASFACIDLIASSFAGLSADVYTNKNRKEEENPLNKVLQNPNLDDTRFNLFYNCIYDYYAEGNVFLFKAYNEAKDLISLFRINPSSVVITVDEFGRKKYTVGGKEYSGKEIIHIPSRYGQDDITKRGKSIFKACSNAFDIANQMDSYTKTLFDNSLSSRTIIDVSKALPNATPEQIQQLKEKYISEFGGIENAGSPIVKTGNVEFNTLNSGIPENRNAQLVENRNFQISEVLRVFGVPEALLTGTNNGDIESVYLSFIERTIRPLTTVFEETFNKVLMDDGYFGFYTKFNYNSLMKTSLQARIDCYVKQVNNGMLTINEVREMEGRKQLEAGDNTFVPANAMPLNNDVIEAYMAKSKATMLEIENQNHSVIGDDKI